MKWPWSKQEAAPPKSVPDHAASHDAARILKTAREGLSLEAYRRGESVCDGAWTALFHAQMYVERACKERSRT